MLSFGIAKRKKFSLLFFIIDKNELTINVYNLVLIVNVATAPAFASSSLFSTFGFAPAIPFPEQAH